MDVNESFRQFLSAVEIGDNELALECGSNVAEWIERGGFLPDELQNAAVDLQATRDDIFPHGGFSRRETYDESAAVEFRLYARPEGTLELNTGDPSYDVDHRGAHGAGSVSAVDSPADILAAVVSAFDDLLESLSQII